MNDLVERACFRAGAVSVWYVEGHLFTEPHVSTEAIQAAVKDLEAEDAAAAYAVARRGEYLRAWPIESQLEALTEHAAGRGEKLEALLYELETIRDRHPKPKGSEA